MKFTAKFRAACSLLHRCEYFAIRPCYQNIVRSLGPQHRPHDLSHLLRRFASRKNNFRIALPQSAMMVHLGEAKILIGQPPQLLDRMVDRLPPTFHSFQKISNVAFVHLTIFQ